MKSCTVEKLKREKILVCFEFIVICIEKIHWQVFMSDVTFCFTLALGKRFYILLQKFGQISNPCLNQVESLTVWIKRETDSIILKLSAETEGWKQHFTWWAIPIATGSTSVNLTQSKKTWQLGLRVFPKCCQKKWINTQSSYNRYHLNQLTASLAGGLTFKLPVRRPQFL